MRSTEELVADETAPLVVVDDGPIRFLIMNRPHSRNALSREMRTDLPGILGDDLCPGCRAGFALRLGIFLGRLEVDP